MNIPPASHSHLTAFEQCPRKYEHYYVLKDVPWETSPEMDKGKVVHKDMENKIKAGYLGHPGRTLRAELKLGITQACHPCDFFDKAVYLRGVLDVLCLDERKPETAVLLDWKTGKRREDPAELKLHAVLARAHHPQLFDIYGHYVWLAEGVVGAQHDLSNTVQTLEQTHEKIDEIKHQLKMGYMPPKQSPLCEWCRVKACEFNPGYQRDARGKSQSGSQKVSA